MALAPARRALIEPFHVMEIVAAAAEQELATGDVLHLEVGQPSSGAPRGAVAAAIELLESGAALGYTPACGIDPLRRRIARMYHDRYAVEVRPDQVIVTAGASGAVVLALLACFDPGARIVVTEPGYPCYRQMIGALDLAENADYLGGAGWRVFAEARRRVNLPAPRADEPRRAADFVRVGGVELEHQAHRGYYRVRWPLPTTPPFVSIIIPTCGITKLVRGEDIPVAYDRFRNRVMFPITDMKGRPIAFGGRDNRSLRRNRENTCERGSTATGLRNVGLSKCRRDNWN